MGQHLNFSPTIDQAAAQQLEELTLLPPSQAIIATRMRSAFPLGRDTQGQKVTCSASFHSIFGSTPASTLGMSPSANDG